LLQKGEILTVSDPSAMAQEGEGLLFSLRSGKGVYAYLNQIRKLEGCRYAWLFGDELHVTLRSHSDVEGIRKVLDSWEDESLQWKFIVPSIEDRFMDLLQEESITDSELEEGN
jgi:hypothetical protein